MLDLTAAFSPFPVLETERCILRALTPEDAADLLRLWGDPRVTRYLGRLPLTSLDEVSQRLAMFRAEFEARASILWAITSRADGSLMGTIRLLNILAPHSRAEIGYVLSPHWWGKRLIPEAAPVVLDFGFSVMGLHSVEAQTDVENVASRRVLEKLGFVQEGYFRENFFEPAVGRFTDTVVFSLLESTWAERRAA